LLFKVPVEKIVYSNEPENSIEHTEILDFDTVVNTMAFSGYPNGKLALSEFHRVLKESGRLLIVDFDYPSNRNIFGYWLTKLMESAGDTIRDMSKILQDFHFEFTEEEIGGFGSVHFYVARKR
jgi:ubiquinone/menaquinone biosynthesis C-methylase UbiE